MFLKVILCMVFARSAAMAFNRYIDRDFDAKNQRTAIREIPAGIISARSALIFVIISSLAFIGVSALINPLCFALSPVALAVVLGYSYTKRFTWLCHIVLGLGLALAPIGAYLAVTAQFALLPVLVSLAVLFWTSGFDVIYALQDEEFDRNTQLHSIPVWLGKKNALNLSSVLHAFTAALLFLAGREAGFGLYYFIGLGIFLALLIYQHSIVKPHDLSRVNLAFGTTNGIASVIFAVFFLLEFFINQR
ncbi:MAG: putative 4-hydroxybenzoate polyprenyltransferase [Bacteroidetes bacterium]|nr:putative 4-hydroxybenzoate polyprenyltransferase [Bacteroidota bacterium]